MTMISTIPDHDYFSDRDLQFYIVSIPEEDYYARRERIAAQRGAPHLMPTDGAIAAWLHSSSLCPRHVEHDDCSGLVARTRKSAIALRRLLDARGWEYEMHTGRYMCGNSGQWFAEE